MATLVLTVVGGLVGGPVGAAVGAAIGQQVDAAIFKPKGREGPRLADLKVQASTYGQHIPQMFGTMRVAGSVICRGAGSPERTVSSMLRASGPLSTSAGSVSGVTGLPSTASTRSPGASFSAI